MASIYIHTAILKFILKYLDNIIDKVSALFHQSKFIIKILWGIKIFFNALFLPSSDWELQKFEHIFTHKIVFLACVEYLNFTESNTLERGHAYMMSPMGL